MLSMIKRKHSLGVGVCKALLNLNERMIMSPTNELDKFIVKNFPSLFPPGIGGARFVYHYTTVDTFEVLTRETADFMCTYCGALNDKAEFATGIKLLERFFASNSSLAYGVSSTTLRNIATEPEFAPWTMSFSLDGDSLNQWIAYTDRHNGGVSIGFDIDQLLNTVNNLKTANQLMYFVPCLYESAHRNEIEMLLDFLFGPYRDGLYKLSLERGLVIDHDALMKMITLSIALIFAAMVKDESFRQEQEWRLVLQPLDELLTQKCDFIGGKPRLRSNLFGKDFILMRSIKDIICSPHGQMYGRACMIARLRNIPVMPRMSKSTYISQ